MKTTLCTMALLALTAFACTKKKKEADVKDPLSDAEQKKLEELRAEIEVGRNMAGRLLQFYGTRDDQVLDQYVNQVGSYVGTFSDHPERRYMFEIINSEMVNAFACPGGYIIITMGAIRHARSEAELAAVLAHESAHVGKKHMFDKLRKMTPEEIEKANALAIEKLKLPETVKARERPRPEDNQVSEVLAKYLSGGALGLNIVKAAGAGMSVMLEQGLGADLEYEADAEGVKYAVRAGYNPVAMVDYLCRLEGKKTGGGEGDEGKCKLKIRKKKKEEMTVLDKTHPPVADRIQNIRKTLAKLDYKSIVGADGESRFKGYKDRLPAPKVAKK